MARRLLRRGREDRPDKVGSFRPALRHRDFRWLFGAATVSYTGSWAYNVALAVFVYGETHSTIWVGAATVGRFVPSLLLSAYGGVIADRFERRNLMVVLDVVSAFIMGLLAILALAEGPVLVAILLAATCGLLGTAYAPAVAAMIPQVVGEEDLAAANSLHSTVENLAVIAGPGFGAVLLYFWSPSVTFVFNGLTFLFSAWAIRRMRTRSQKVDVTEGGSAGLFAQMAVGFHVIAQNSTAAVLVAYSVVASFLYGTDTVLYVVWSGRLGTGTEGYGYLLAALGVGGLVMAPFLNTLSARPRLGLVISIAMIVYALPDILMPPVHQPLVAFLIVVTRGAGTMVVDVLAVTAMQRALPSDVIARVFGVYFALVLGAISVGAVLTPQLIDGAGFTTTSLIYGIGFTVLTILAYPKAVMIDRVTAKRLGELTPRIERIEGLGIFAAASRATIERLAAVLSEVSVPAGTRVITEGTAADAFFVIVSGSVDVMVKTSKQVEVRVNTLGAGDWFGEIGLIEQVPRTASVDATEPCELFRIEGADFLSALAEDAISASFLEGAKTRLSATRWLTDEERAAARDSAN